MFDELVDLGFFEFDELAARFEYQALQGDTLLFEGAIDEEVFDEFPLDIAGFGG